MVASAQAAFSARALPPGGNRSHCTAGCTGLGALSVPNGAAASPYARPSTPAVASLEPSSAITIVAAGAVCASNAAIVTGRLAASLRAATITVASGKGAPGQGASGSGLLPAASSRTGARRRNVRANTKPSSAVS